MRWVDDGVNSKLYLLVNLRFYNSEHRDQLETESNRIEFTNPLDEFKTKSTNDSVFESSRTIRNKLSIDAMSFVSLRFITNRKHPPIAYSSIKIAGNSK